MTEALLTFKTNGAFATLEPWPLRLFWQLVLRLRPFPCIVGGFAVGRRGCHCRLQRNLVWSPTRIFSSMHFTLRVSSELCTLTKPTMKSFASWMKFDDKPGFLLDAFPAPLIPNSATFWVFTLSFEFFPEFWDFSSWVFYECQKKKPALS